MRSPTRGDRSGFVLMLVVLMLFAISLAAATGYEMVRSEFLLSAQNRDGQQALSVARAGLQRFLGEHVGHISDTVRYAVGDGIATVTARKLYERDADNHLYYIRSEGTLDDLRNPQGTVTNLRSQGVPTRRTVGTARGDGSDIDSADEGASGGLGIVRWVKAWVVI